MREGNLYRHLEAERKFLPLFFAFDHVHYARYNSFQHIYLKHLQTTKTNAFNDLCIQGYGATSTGDPFSAIHGDIVTEHFNRETKGTAGPNRAGYIENTVNKWIMTSHIHIVISLKKRMKVYTSSTHKELTPGNKSMHNSQVKSLKQTLAEYNVDPFSDGPVVHITTGKELDQDIVTDLLNAENR